MLVQSLSVMLERPAEIATVVVAVGDRLEFVPFGFGSRKSSLQLGAADHPVMPLAIGKFCPYRVKLSEQLTTLVGRQDSRISLCQERAYLGEPLCGWACGNSHATVSHNWRATDTYLPGSRGRDGLSQDFRAGRCAMTRHPAARRLDPDSVACV